MYCLEKVKLRYQYAQNITENMFIFHSVQQKHQYLMEEKSNCYELEI